MQLPYGQLAESQEKLRTGQMSQQEYDRSLAETTQRVAEVAAKHPDSAAVQTSAARAYLQAGDLGKAVAHASQAMALAPNDPFPLATRGLAYFEAKDFPRAAEDARRALEVAPGDPVAHALYMLSKDRPAGGSSAAILGAPARAGREVIALPANPYVSQPAALRPGDDPEIARYKTEEGRNYARQVIAAEKAVERKDYLTAFGMANAALATYADNPRVLAARAVAAWNLRDFRTAVSDATLALKAKPDMQPMLIARAAAYNDMGRHADALRDAERAVALAPNRGRAYIELAIAREGLHEPAESILAEYRRAAELDPQYKPDYAQALSRLASGQEGLAAGGGGDSSRPSRSAQNFLGAMASRAHGISWPKAALGVAGLFGLLGAALLLARRE